MSNYDYGKVFDHTPRASINPYLVGAGFIVRRLLWDLNPLSWRARKKIKRWKDRHKNEKAIIICNGPSLNKVEFEELVEKSIFTFGLNKINLLFERTSFRPSCIVAVNPLVLEQNATYYNDTTIPLFLDAEGSRWIRDRENIHFIHSSNNVGHFARDCSISVHKGGTVTYVALQLAFHMGFSDVALIGCDHSFETKGPANKKVKGSSEDIDHFDPRYFSSGMEWQLPDLAASELHYEKARNVYTHFNRRIINCTEGGKLEIFEKMPLGDFLKEKQLE